MQDTKSKTAVSTRLWHGAIEIELVKLAEQTVEHRTGEVDGKVVTVNLDCIFLRTLPPLKPTSVIEVGFFLQRIPS
jgi:hypothetical protein